MPEVFRIPAPLRDALLAAARARPALECCGLLGGTGGTVTAIFPAEPAEPSASRFEIPPEQLFAMFRQMRDAGLELAGIYHSHPGGENVPSALDVARHFYPDAACVILSPQPDAARPLRAYRIAGGEVRELRVEIADAAD